MSASPSLLAIFDVGGGEMMLIFFIVLLLFGGKKMPEFARGLGKSIREFKKATAGVEDQIKRALDDEPETIAPPKKPRYTPPPATIEPAATEVIDDTPPAPATAVESIPAPEPEKPAH
jgi:sec-independent protein translocase protein TatA